MKTLTKTKVNGFVRMLDMGEAIQRAMAKGKYEPEQTAWVKKVLPRGGRFVDVGANFGYYSSLASSIVGTSGRVFAFEPSPVAQERRNLNTTPAQLLETILGMGFTINCTGKKVTGMESCGKVPYELQDMLFTWK